ncbi:MAG: signal peptidase I [Pirellulales bacterium]
MSGRSERGAELTEESPGKKKHLPFLVELVLLLAVALGLAIVIKAFFVQAFYIPSGSMNDTLVKNDRVLVEKPSYWRGGPSRGDVVVFADPGGWLDASESAGPANDFTKLLEKVGLYPTGGHLVKRVIGVGGDHVVCCDEKGRITVNDVPLNETSLPRARREAVAGRVRSHGPRRLLVGDGRQPLPLGRQPLPPG